jgi:hypothetical protein
MRLMTASPSAVCTAAFFCPSTSAFTVAAASCRIEGSASRAVSVDIDRRFLLKLTQVSRNSATSGRCAGSTSS